MRFQGHRHSLIEKDKNALIKFATAFTPSSSLIDELNQKKKLMLISKSIKAIKNHYLSFTSKSYLNVIENTGVYNLLFYFNTLFN